MSAGNNSSLVALPREVVERAIEALRGSETPTYRAQYDIEIDALVDLRSALEQPDAETPATAPEGWRLVPVVPTPKMVSEGSCSVTLPGPRYIDESAAKKCWAHMLAAAPQPPTTKQSLTVQPQGEQEPVAWIENLGGGISYNPYHDAARKLPDGVRFDLYVHQQNLRCKSNQARLAALWGYEKKQPPRQPLTDDQHERLMRGRSTLEYGRSVERAHGIGGEA